MSHTRPKQESLTLGLPLEKGLGFDPRPVKLDAGPRYEETYRAKLDGLARHTGIWGSLAKVKRIFRLDGFIAFVGEIREQPKVANAASQPL